MDRVRTQVPSVTDGGSDRVKHKRVKPHARETTPMSSSSKRRQDDVLVNNNEELEDLILAKKARLSPRPSAISTTQIASVSVLPAQWLPTHQSPAAESDPLGPIPRDSVAMRQEPCPVHPSVRNAKVELRCKQLKQENRALRKALNKALAEQEARELKIRQDMFLDLVSERDHHERTRHELAMARAHNKQLAKTHEQLAKTHEQLSKTHEQLQRETSKLAEEKLAMANAAARVVSDVRSLRVEVQHQKHTNQTLEQDLDELQRIENEDKAQRHRETLGLPPAYGSIDDDAHKPPYYNQHRDCGSVEIAAIKRSIREHFLQRVVTLAAMTEESRASTNRKDDPDGADSMMLCMLAGQVNEAARKLYSFLPDSGYVFVRHLDPFVGHDPSNSLPSAKWAESRHTARNGFMADRMAKLLLDLCVRFISALETRPRLFKLTPAGHMAVGVALKGIDDVLLELLRCSFDHQTRPEQRLWELQNYLTLVEMLQRQFRSLRTGLRRPLLKGSMEWLSDCVEKEREDAAQRGYTIDGEAAGAGSEISSEAAAMGSDASQETALGA